MLNHVSFLRISVLVVGIFAVVLGPGSQKAEAAPGTPEFDFFTEFYSELGVDPAECVVSPTVLRKKCKQARIDRKIARSEIKVDRLAAKLATFDDGNKKGRRKIKKWNEKYEKEFKKLLRKIRREIGL